MKKKPLIWFRFELALLIALLGLFSWQVQRSAATSRVGGYRFAKPIVEVRRMIMEQYVEAPDERTQMEMRTRAIRGMLDALNDPFTTYYTPEQYADFQQRTKSSLVGIGVIYRFNAERKGLLISTPMAGGPALEAGIRAGDLITGVNGKSIAEYMREVADSKDFDDASEAEINREAINRAGNNIKGKAGTPVRLSVIAPDGKSRELTIIRAPVRIRTIEGWEHDNKGTWSYLMDQGTRVGYIRMTSFAEPTFEELQSAMQELESHNAQGLILDLRNNPGGLLKAARQIADLFLEEGVIVSTKGRTGRPSYTRATSANTIADLPMVVLINGESASASEILAGALKDNNRAIIVGTRSYGKGLVQNVSRLPENQGGLSITTHYFYLPSGRNIHRLEGAELWGVDPNEGYYSPMTATEEAERLKIRRDIEIIHADPSQDFRSPPQISGQWIQETLKDSQMAAAYNAIRIRIATGAFTPTGMSSQQANGDLSESEALKIEKEQLEQRLEQINNQLKVIDQNKNQSEEKLPATQPAE